MKNKQKEPYLKIPAHILNIADISLSEKVLLAHIYSFGTKGCYQSNQTLAEIFMVSPSTIRRWLSRIQKFTHVKNPKGYYRTIWAKSLCKNEHGPAQNCASDLVKSANRPARNCAPTNNNTITETSKETIASPAPPPTKGVPATLEYRRQQSREEIEQFKARFGRTSSSYKPMSPAEFERRRAEILAQLGIGSSGSQRKEQSIE
jgi:hypothetical protein